MTRSELAQQLYAVAQSNIECCQKLIQDQHFQHQGWNAVLANIEDLSKVVANKLEALKIQYEKFKSRGPIYNQSIDRLVSFTLNEKKAKFHPTNQPEYQ